MIGPIVTLAVAVLAAWLLTPVIGRLAWRWNIVDRPDGERKLHHGAIPLGGGLGVYGAMVLGLLAAAAFNSLGKDYTQLASLIALAAGIAGFFGCIDDACCLKARYKLALQTLSVLPIVLVGNYVDWVVVLGYHLELGWLGIPLTVLWLLGCINALNLMDGMDGLASVVGLSTVGMMGLIAANEGHPHVAVIALVLAGALTGFLIHNHPPARIFLGDSGSMVIGLTVGVLGMQGTLKSTATLSIAAPVVVMTLPMFDVVAAVVRRALTGRPLTAPDRKHIHHRLLDRGLSPWQVLCILGALCLTTGGAATFATLFRKDALAWIAALILVVLMIRMRLFGHHEFSLLRRFVGGLWLTLKRWWLAAVRSPWFHLDAHPPFSLERAWSTLVEDAKAWNVQRLEAMLSQGARRDRRCWVDPRSSPERTCRWSVVVSMQAADDWRCELHLAGSDRPAPPERLELLTARLRAFGIRLCELAAHSEGLPLLEEIPTPPIPYFESPRKAA